MIIISVMTVIVLVCAMFIHETIMVTMRMFKTNQLIMMMMWYNGMSQ